MVNGPRLLFAQRAICFVSPKTRPTLGWCGFLGWIIILFFFLCASFILSFLPSQAPVPVAKYPQRIMIKVPFSQVRNGTGWRFV